MFKKTRSGTASTPKRWIKISTKQTLALAQSLRPRGGHLPLALVADKLAVRYRYSRGRPIRVKPETLAATLNLSLPQVKRALADLRDARLIKFMEQSRHKARKTYGGSIYEVWRLVDRLDEIHFQMQPPPPQRRAPRPSRARIGGAFEAMEVARLDFLAYLSDMAEVTGWGVPRYDEELRREVEEAIYETRADAQAEADWVREELEEFAAGALAQYEIWNLPGHLSLQDAREEAHEDGPSDEDIESVILARREWLDHLRVEGPALAVMGIPPYLELLAAHFPDLYVEVMSLLSSAVGTPEAR